MKPTQKFPDGSLVQIADDLGESMSHFTSGVRAIVCHTFAGKYGGNDHSKYSMYLEGHGESAWYKEDQLTLIDLDRADLLDTWKAAAEVLHTRYGDLDWIFANVKPDGGQVPASSVEALAKCLGVAVADLWGPNGEGLAYFTNCRKVLHLAAEFLRNGDKGGWLEYCKTAEVKP